MQPAFEERVDDLEIQANMIESALGQLIITVNSYIRRSEREMKEFKDEMKEFKDEMKADRRAMNQKWGELANKMGTLVEDIVLPNLPRIFKDYFGVSPEDLNFFAPRPRIKHLTDRSKRREFDAVGISDNYVFINETKSKPDHKDIEKFAAMAGELPNYIPEAGDRPAILIFSALYLSEDLVADLTRCGIYAMEMKDDTMDLMNFDALDSRR